MEVTTASQAVYDKSDPTRWKFLGVMSIDVTVCNLEEEILKANPTMQVPLDCVHRCCWSVVNSSCRFWGIKADNMHARYITDTFLLTLCLWHLGSQDIPALPEETVVPGCVCADSYTYKPIGGSERTYTGGITP